MVSNNIEKYNDVMKKLQDYIICEKYVKHIKQRILKNTKNINKNINKNSSNDTNTNNNSKVQQNVINNDNNKNITQTNNKPTIKNPIYYPKDQDALYWILYIMQHSIMDYEYNKNQRFILEKENKIKYVEQLKSHKETIKRQKLMSLSDFENNLIHEKKISINTFLNLCAIEKKNVIFVKKKIFYELLMTDNEDVYIVYHSNSNSNYDKYGFEMCKKDDAKWKNIYSKYIQTNNIMCPIKSISYYKLDDLIQMCEKFGLPTLADGTAKNKKKSELYEDIIQHLS